MHKPNISPLSALLLFAAPLCVTAEENPEHWLDRTTLYASDDGWFQQLDLSGRLQLDASYTHADEGDYDDVDFRRFRFGFKAALAGDWVAQLEGDFDLNFDGDQFYKRLTDAYVGWQPEGGPDVRLLKHSAGFTLDGATSSKKLLTTERSNLSNNFWFNAEYFTGVSAKGTTGDAWDYRVGLFSSDGNDEFSEFNASFFTLTSLGYNWAQQLQMDQASVRVDYVYNDRDPVANTADLSHVVSISSKWEGGSWGLWTDLAFAEGYYDQPDIWGMTLMPFYQLGENLQLVSRVTYLDSDGPNGIGLGNYEKQVVTGRGDLYKEIHAGINWFFYGHKLKWQTGLQWAELDDVGEDGGRYAGWTVVTALRVYW